MGIDIERYEVFAANLEVKALKTVCAKDAEDAFLWILIVGFYDELL